MDILSYLSEWVETYIKSRDAFHKKIISIDNSTHTLKIKKKDILETIYILPDLDKFNSQEKINNLTIFTLNNRHNLDTLYQRWPEFSKKISLKVYFINPFSLSEKKWGIIPHTHARFCDDSSLKPGLRSMFETVEPLTNEILEQRIGNTVSGRTKGPN